VYVFVTEPRIYLFRINHNILATNYFLKKIKIIDDANCNFCQKENETIEHIFGGCENVIIFSILYKFIKQALSESMDNFFFRHLFVYIYSILCSVKWHCIHHVYILYQHIPLNTNWYSLSKYTFFVYIYYTIVYFIVYSLWDN
jgi:hypothetical protein